MDLYSLVKITHILSSTVVFGTGIGIAFFMLWANLKGDLAAKVYAAKTTVTADFLFTTPAIIIQPITGIMLVNIAGYSFTEYWLILTYICYGVSIVCWLPVVWIQIKLRTIAIKAFQNKVELPEEYYKLFKMWFILGWPALISLIIIFGLMVIKPS